MSEAAMRTLKYWTPGPYADHVHERYDTDMILRCAYDGLAECMELGLLRHVSNFSQYADGYRPTARGAAILDALRRKSTEVAR